MINVNKQLMLLMLLVGLLLTTSVTATWAQSQETGSVPPANASTETKASDGQP